MDWPTLVPFLVAGLLFVVGLTGVVIILRRKRRSRSAQATWREALAIDLNRLTPADSSQIDHWLHIYGTPVRLVGLVVAPKGRSMQLPNRQQLRILIQRIAPNLDKLLDEHAPKIDHWPPQMSDEGFVHTFFHHLSFPGDKGRGTPWCALAGSISAGMGRLMIGMIGYSDEPTQLGQIEIAHEGQWREIVKVAKRSAD